MDNDKCCGKCQYHKTDEKGEWYCGNELSDYYALETDYNGGEDCVDYEDKE